MVDAPAANEAAAIARQCPGLGVGLHLVLSQEDPAIWGLRLLASKTLRSSVRPLIERQIERLLSFGLKPTHIDSHWNAHVHPLVFPQVLAAARRYGIPRVRWPGGELPAAAAYALEGPLARLASLPFQAALASTYSALGIWLKGSAPEVTRSFGMLRSGMMTEDYVVWLLRRLPPGPTELYFHPSSDAASEIHSRPAEGHRTVTELRALLSPRVREVLAQERIDLACKS
jgi:hypothetical protein